MKAISYLLFLNLSLSNACLANVMVSNAVELQTFQKENINHFDFSQNTTFDYKNDVFNYSDDNDDYECDEHETPLKVKLIIFSTYFSNNNKPMARWYATKDFCNNKYNHVNFSRLPRFDYISLKVLRL